jgi:hypothetical protein
VYCTLFWQPVSTQDGHLQANNVKFTKATILYRTFNEFYAIGLKMTTLRVISGFRRDVYEICPLLGYYAAWSGNSLPTFRDNV